jgi:hypothetical protein
VADASSRPTSSTRSRGRGRSRAASSRNGSCARRAARRISGVKKILASSRCTAIMSAVRAARLGRRARSARRSGRRASILRSRRRSRIGGISSCFGPNAFSALLWLKVMRRKGEREESSARSDVRLNTCNFGSAMRCHILQSAIQLSKLPFR